MGANTIAVVSAPICVEFRFQGTSINVPVLGDFSAFRLGFHPANDSGDEIANRPQASVSVSSVSPAGHAESYQEAPSMTRTEERTDLANERNGGIPGDYGRRAAYAINRLVPGPNRDKAVARLFECSIRTAQYLRAGLHWSIDRLNIASKKVNGFDAYLATDLNARLDFLEQELAELRGNLRTRDNG